MMNMGMPMDAYQFDMRSRHGSSSSSGSVGGSHNMYCSSSSVSPASQTNSGNNMISQGDNSSASCLYNRSLSHVPTTAAPLNINSINAFNTAINSNNVPTARKLDRSISEPCDRNGNLQSSKNPANINSTRYKTELCRPFEENGYCKYGDKCQFAHGSNEQRNLARHPKYKTELCRTFHTIGFCPYGPRCHFIHNEDELKLGQIIHMKQQQQAAAHAALQQVAAQSTLQQIQQQLQSTSPVNLPTRSHSVSSPTPVQRPRTLNFSLSLNMVRDSLGSTADSPPSSFTDSPTMSPNYLADDLLAVSMALCNTPPASAPAAVTSAFTFPPEYCQPIPSTPTPIMTPLNVQTTDPLVSLAAGLQAASLRNNLTTTDALRELNDAFYTPPSPPDSLNGDSIITNTCETPLEVSRGLRLPIFSRLAHEN